MPGVPTSSAVFRRLATAVLICVAAVRADSPQDWKFAGTPHFQLYTQSADAKSAASLLAWLEQLHTFFVRQAGLDPGNRTPVRVMAFRSKQGYDPYRLGSASDAYFIGSPERDYIVLSQLRENEFSAVAHEYSHLVLRSPGRELPAWLNEGLAEIFSTLRISNHGSALGGEIPAHSQVLRRNSWIALGDLLSMKPAAFRDDRNLAVIFYAESWALTDMLALSPGYAPLFPQLVREIASGVSGREALHAVYSKPLETVFRDVHDWANLHLHPSLTLPPIAREPSLSISFRDVSAFEIRSVTADLLLASGELERAQAEYVSLAQQQPSNGSVAVALGAIALRKHDYMGARDEWKRAMDLGIDDPGLLYRYSSLADAAGIPSGELRQVLQRLLIVQPDCDDARFRLALLENNSAHFDAAIAQLTAMSNVPPQRAFGYWTALAYALNQVDRFEEAVAAGRKALSCASTASEREHAGELISEAQTEPAVRFTTDSNGRRHMIATRIPRGTVDWNPFIQPEDVVRRLAGTLQDVHCAAGALTAVVIATGEALTTLSVPDPSQVQIRNGPSQLMCGPQKSTFRVVVDYAAGQAGQSAGLIRGIGFQ
jgi:hypothetical protein